MQERKGSDVGHKDHINKLIGYNKAITYCFSHMGRAFGGHMQ